METLLKRMYDLAKEEYERANSTHGPIASAHEGWALAKEELEETQEELDDVEVHLCHMWTNIRQDDLHEAKRSANMAWAAAIRCACEAVQVAAVCYRFMDLEENKTLRNLSPEAKKLYNNILTGESLKGEQHV